jgi:hypothetical protein
MKCGALHQGATASIVFVLSLSQEIFTWITNCTASCRRLAKWAEPTLTTLCVCGVASGLVSLVYAVPVLPRADCDHGRGAVHAQRRGASRDGGGDERGNRHDCSHRRRAHGIARRYALLTILAVQRRGRARHRVRCSLRAGDGHYCRARFCPNNGDLLPDQSPGRASPRELARPAGPSSSQSHLLIWRPRGSERAWRFARPVMFSSGDTVHCGGDLRMPETSRRFS